MSASAGNSQVFALGNLLAPATGQTHGVKFSMSLSSNSATINWDGLLQSVGSWLPQAMYVNNLGNNANLVVTETSSGWQTVVVAGTAKTVQFPCVSHPVFNIACATGSANLDFWLFDWPAFPDEVFNPTSGGASGVVLIGGQPIEVVLQGNMLPPAPVTYAAAAAHTVTSGGTAITVFTAGQIVTQGIITNPSTAKVGFQIAGPYPCQQAFFKNCVSPTATPLTGASLYVGAPTGSAELLTRLLTGQTRAVNHCTARAR